MAPVRGGKPATMVAVLLAWLAVVVIGSAAATAAPPQWTEAERTWLAEHREISVGIVADNEPYSFYRDGQTLGWSVDLLRRLEDLSGLRMRFRMGTWSEIYGEFLNGGLDVIEAISLTPERSRIILFTAPYHLRRMMVFHDAERPLPPDPGLDVLKGRRIGVIKDIYYGSALRDLGLDLVEYAGYRDLMAALAFGWIEAAVAPELTGDFFARENGFTSIAIAGPLPAAAVSLEDFRLGISPQQPELRGILDKALAALPEGELAQITERWRSWRGGFRMGGATFRLLPEEQEWVAGAPTIRVGFMPDYEPFSYLADGRGQGFALDLVEDVAVQAGLVVEPVFDTWPHLLDRLRSGDIHMIGNMSYTPDRAEWARFTEPYHRIPNAVFVRDGFGPYQGAASLAGRRIAIGRDIFYEDRVKERFGDAVVTFTSQAEMLQALADGRVDAAIMALPNGTSLVRKLGLITLQIAGEFTVPGVEREDLRFGVAQGLPYLHSIVDRAIAAMPASRWAEMETRWLGPRLSSAPRAAPLTPEERRLLADKGVVRACAGPPMPPYEDMGTDGDYAGVAADVMRLLAERGGFTWALVPSPARRGAGVDWVARSACDIMPFAAQVPVADGTWTLTEPYMALPLVVASRLEQPFLDGMASLGGTRLGVPRGYGLLSYLQARHTTVTFVEVPDELEGLRDVARQDLDGVVGTLASLSHLIIRHRLSDLKISGRLPDEWRIGVAVRTADPALGAVFGKLVATLEEVEVEDILNRWMAARVERRADYTLLSQFGGAAVVVLALFLVWNRKLRRLNTALAEANGKLEVLSRTDTLTGLPNRRAVEERLEEAFAVARRHGLNFAVAMIDVDHFKRVNDDLGHPFGDACLRQVGDLLNRHFTRDSDGVGRYGGEEFLAFAVGDRPEDFAAHLETLRERVSRHVVAFGDLKRHVTISIGWHAAVPAASDGMADTVAAADACLYEAKGAGRNRVIGQDAEVAAE